VACQSLDQGILSYRSTRLAMYQVWALVARLLQAPSVHMLRCRGAGQCESMEREALGAEQRVFVILPLVYQSVLVSAASANIHLVYSTAHPRIASPSNHELQSTARHCTLGAMQDLPNPSAEWDIIDET